MVLRKTNGLQIIVRHFSLIDILLNNFLSLVVAFFNHVNALYNAVCDVCTPVTCPVMTGPQNRFDLYV
jgi:hypothetical protein